MIVEQIMTRNVHTCAPDDTIDVATGLMWHEDIGSVPVTMSGADGSQTVVAMLTDRDVAMAAYTQGLPLREIKVATAMSRELCSCHARDPVSLALKIMEKNQLHRLPVVSGDMQLVGIVSLADLAREARREHGHVRREVEDLQVAEAVEAIAQPRHAQREIMTVV